MAPILIDNRGLVKLGLISVLFTVVVFTAGFFSGYQEAITIQHTASEIEPLVIPAIDKEVVEAIEHRQPAIIEAGELIDVDQPITAAVVVSAKKTVTQHIKQQPSTGVLIAKNGLDEKSNFNANAEKDSAGKKSDVVNAVKTLAKENDIAEDTTIINTSLMSPDDISKIKYSIQVGMYGRLVNAENMMHMLQAQKFDAYVSDYTNKKNKIRYNVRFGYYHSKKSALTALKGYKNIQKSDGYLVKFSVKNITKLADARSLTGEIKSINDNQKIEAVEDAAEHKNEFESVDPQEILIKADSNDIS